MKNVLLILNVVLLAAVSYLFYLQFSGKNTGSDSPKVKTDSSAAASVFRMAYFEMDSIDSNYEMIKDVRKELGKKEDANNAEAMRLEKKYNDRLQVLQKTPLTPEQQESAKNELMQMQQNIGKEKQAMMETYTEYQSRRLKEIQKRIEDFLAKYNSDRKYSYIMSYEPGMFFYKDTSFNITADVVKGLNEDYKLKKQ
jgi:outer membrane protein